MHLKRIEIQGFKSFPQRTVLEFGSGVTAVIGPNGSGKSNVADAVRWVMGEQSPRVMRLRRLEDALYLGGGRRPPAGFAEVTLWLDNGDGWLPLDFSEIVVGRRLHRSGEVDYQINGRRVRLRDVQDLLLRARLGQNSYAIMGQGLVDHVLSLRPDERRGLLEEAAEIRRFRLRLDETRTRLSATRDNLDRVQTVVAEIAPRLIQLERQARRAREHAELSAQLAVALRRSFASRLAAAAAAHTQAQAEEQRTRAAQAAAQTALAASESAAEGTRAELEAVEQAERQQRDQIARLAETERADRQRLRLEEDRIGFLRQRLGEIDADIAALSRDQADLLRPAAGEDALDPEALPRAHAALLDRQRSLNELDAALQQLRQEAQQAENAARRANGDLRALRDQAALVAQGIERVQADGAGQTGRRSAALARLREAGQRYRVRFLALREAETALAQARASHTAAVAALDEARRALAGRQSDAQQARAHLAGRQQQRQLVARLHDHRSQQGSRQTLQAAGVATAGLPTLRDLLNVPAAYEVAIQAVLGDLLGAVIVADAAEAERLLDRLAASDGGRAHLLPTAVVGKPDHCLPDLPNGVVGSAASLVSASDEYRAVVGRLLGGVLVTKTFAAAHAAVALGATLAVTLSGTVIGANGVISGGPLAQADNTLALNRELAELDREIDAARHALAAAEAALSEAQRSRDTAQQLLRQVEPAVTLAERALAKQRDQLASARAAIAPAGADLHYLRTSAATASARLHELTAEQDRLAARLGETEQRARAANAALGSARRRLDEQQGNRDGLVRALAEARGEVASLERQAETLAAERERQRVAAARLAERLASRQREAGTRRDEIALVEQDCADLRTGIDRTTAAHAALDAERAPLHSRLTALRATAEEERRTLDRARRALADTERTALAAEAEAERRAQALDRLREEIAAEGLEPDSLGGGSETSDGAAESESALQERIRSLRARIRNLGAVYAEAEADYQANRERHDFLTAQTADLRAAEAGLHELIEELRRQISERFQEAFTRVAAEFETCFQAFFGGGTAQLTLTTPDHGDDPGIEIIARPPGKRAQHLALLSGGERAMTAVALLFALLRYNPAPFCVLDEVDAALDEANVGRFGEALRQLADRTQFVVITHNRGTIEVADTIYGVSMQGDGASSVLSLRLADVPA